MKNIKTFETFSINEKGMNPGFAAYLAKKKKGKKGEEKEEEKEEEKGKKECDCKTKPEKKSKKKNESISNSEINELFLEASSNAKFDIAAIKSFKNENPEVVKNPTYIENLKKYYPQISKQIK